MVGIALLSILSTQHLKAAALFSRQAERIENKHVDDYHDLSSKEKERITSDYRSFVIAAVVLCASFLEAFANELWSYTHQNKGSDFLKSIDQRKIEMMGALWDRHEIPKTARYPILRKFEMFLSEAGRAAYDKGQSPYQDVTALVTLRNELIHYTPLWSSVTGSRELPGYQEIENLLTGKVTLSPFGGNTFFPEKCLSHGCAAWAVESAISFCDDFCARIGTTPHYDAIRATLETSGIRETESWD